MNHFSKQPIQYKLLVLLIAAASCVRVFVCFQHNPMDYLWSDPLRHWMNGVRFPRGGYTGAGDPIVYQVYVFVLHRLTGDNKLLVGLASAVLSVLMPWTYYRAARNFGVRKIPALWVWALIAWTPSLLTIYHYIMMETLLLLLEGAALWMSARYLRKGGTEAFLVSVFAWTLACLTKPTVVPLAGICFLWGWWKKSTSLRDIAIAAAMAIVMLLPQAIRSKVELGFFAPFGNPWLTKIMLRSGATMTQFHFYTHSDESLGFHPQSADIEMEFRSPSCYIKPLSPLSSWAIRRASVDSEASVMINSAHGERDWKEAYASFDNDRDEWLAQWRENVVLFFFAASWPESVVPGWDGRMEYMGRWMWAPLIVLVLAFNVREFARRRFALIPVAVTVFTLLLACQNVVLTEGRYRKPLEPLLWLNLVWVISGNGVREKRIEDPIEATESAV